MTGSSSSVLENIFFSQSPCAASRNWSVWITAAIVGSYWRAGQVYYLITEIFRVALIPAGFQFFQFGVQRLAIEQLTVSGRDTP